MPKVLRRTEKTEKAQEYSVPDLIIELAKKVVEDTKKGLKKKVSKKFTDKEVLDIGLAPQGGLLKPYGVGKLIGSGIRVGRNYPGVLRKYPMTRDKVEKEWRRLDASIVSAGLKVPQSEWGRIRNIRFSPGMTAKGQYFHPPQRLIRLGAGHADESTLWHEFTHARQYKPREEEALDILVLRRMNDMLEGIRADAKTSWEFYQHVSPIERQARTVGQWASWYPREFGKAFKRSLAEELRVAEKRVVKFFGEKGKKKIWQSAINELALKQGFPKYDKVK